MTYRIVLIALLVVSAGLTGCRHLRNMGYACHDAKPYQRAQSVTPLKIPAGLDKPDAANALHIPALDTPAPPPRKRTDPCLDEPPPFNTPKQAPPQA
jgi:uncharacterized lipoprotein